MFELRVALKYLLPKRKSLSTALVSLMSVAVISLVVWLVLVFLSVTAGIEKNWLQKLTSLYAPLRLSPTEKYYRSYFYQIDALASLSNYSLKTLGEKAESPLSNPYSEEIDAEVPFYWAKPELKEGIFLDPVKDAVAEVEGLKKEFPGLAYQDYEISGALLKLDMEREGRIASLSQMSYLLSMPDENPHLADLLVASSPTDTYRAELKSGKNHLPEGTESPILLPKSYRDSGVLLGDKGFLAYSIPTASSLQEQRLPVRVAGFYDPGFLSLGNRCLIVPGAITRQIYASTQTFSPDGSPTNGFFLWPKNLAQVEPLKKMLQERLQRAGLSDYWTVATFEDYEFSKDLLQQFRSDRTLFTLIAAIILLVACCNIISLLILLVNDKKREIAILQSMGASFKSIAGIFALSGTLMGLLGCLFGTLLALFTLHHLSSVVSFLSAIQGRSAFNPAFFGQHLPNSLSLDALRFVLIATPILSSLAGLIPAIRASKIRPSQVLRSE